MPSLDGYSLNEKMDRELKDMNNEIEEIRSKIEAEITIMHEKFAELDIYLKALEPLKNKETKNAKSKKMQQN
jgi:small-conductance mechanosensitive channel